jgi:hypothetical protein
MMVSELRKSPTGERVKTYNFMIGEDQMPVIQVEPPIQVEPLAAGSLFQMSSTYSSFDSEDEEEWDSNPYPHGGMDNFATGIMDTFESNLLKLKDFQTQSLPDVFEATKHFADDVSDVSPLSSTSVSTVSILESTNALDHPHDSPSGNPPRHMSPLALNGHTSPSRDVFGVARHSYSTDPVKKKKTSDEIGRRPGSAASSRTWESNSPLGSEGSESAQQLLWEKPKRPLSLPNGGLVTGNVFANGLDSPCSHHRQCSSEEGASNKRSSKVSTSSSKYDYDSLRYVEWEPVVVEWGEDCRLDR